MPSQEVTNLIVLLATYLVILLGPTMLANIAFDKPGREIAAHVCNLTSASILLITVVYGFTQFVTSNNPLAIGITIFYGAMSLLWVGTLIYLIRKEVLKRRKVLAETLF